MGIHSGALPYTLLQGVKLGLPLTPCCPVSDWKLAEEPVIDCAMMGHLLLHEDKWYAEEKWWLRLKCTFAPLLLQ